MASSNRGTIINVVYVIVFLLLIYYVYMFLAAGNQLELTLVPTKIPANTPMQYKLDNTSGVRIMTGGEYTLSFWMYIKDWTVRGGLYKSVLQITDANLPDNFLLNVMVYPNEPKLVIRVHQDKTGSGSATEMDLTNVKSYNQVLGGSSIPSVTTNVEMPQCDLTEIDLQRWINVTIVMNGRIMDVYYDGKLNRSCVLPNLPVGTEGTSQQTLMTGNWGGFNGFLSSVVFNGQALTPDRIYAIYQAGPVSSNGFMDYLADKLGFKLQWYGKDSNLNLINASVSSRTN